MTNQEIFDKVVAHLRKQNAPSIEGINCLYRGPNGLKCAVGCLISDDAYSCNLEGQVVDAREVRSALLASGVHDDEITIVMLRLLQMMHDTCGQSKWEDNFRNIALMHNLTYSPP